MRMWEKRYTPEEARLHAKETVSHAKMILAEEISDIRTKQLVHA